MPGTPPGPNGDIAGAAAAAAAATAAADVTGGFGVVEGVGFELGCPLLLLPIFREPPAEQIVEFDDSIHKMQKCHIAVLTQTGTPVRLPAAAP